MLCHEICQIFVRRKLFCSVCQKKTGNTGSGKVLSQNELNVVLTSAQHRALRLKRSCDPYSILRSLLRNSGSSDHMKAGTEIMCSGGRSYFTSELQQKREVVFVWRILILAFKSGKVCGVKNGYMYSMFTLLVLLCMIHQCSVLNVLFMLKLAEPAQSALEVWKRSSSDLSSFVVSDALIEMLAHSQRFAQGVYKQQLDVFVCEPIYTQLDYHFKAVS